jgi:hypothetical protein
LVHPRRLRFIVALLFVAGVGVAAAVVPGWRTISAPTPWELCPSAGTNGLFANAEVEPSIAVDAARPASIVAVYQQDRFSGGAARGLMAAFSRDGGAHWTRRQLPFTACADGATTGWARASDPWVSLGPDHRAYAIGLGPGVAVSTSTNGGGTWSAPVVLASNSSSAVMDKCTVTADPARAGTAYAVWQRYQIPASGPPTDGDTVLSVTHDGGRHWSAARVVLAREHMTSDIASQILVDAKRHRLYHLAYRLVGDVPGPNSVTSLVVQTSTNGGDTWSAARELTRVRTIGGGLRDPASRKIIRPGVPSFALDPSTGKLYAAWQDSRFSGGRLDHVAFAGSADGGRTWSAPRRVDTGRGALGIIPVVDAAAGRVAVSYYAVAARRTQLWLATSTDGRTFARRAVGPSFAVGNAPLLAGDPTILVPPGLFLGDYTGLTIHAGRAYLAFATANAARSNPTDVRFASVPLR